MYDETTGLYYLNTRYYSPEDGVFLSQDTYRGEANDAASWNLYGYCEGDPINYTDPTGHFLETLFDIASIADSGYNLVTNPSWENFGYFAWDVGATIVPCVPGSYTAKGVKAVSKLKKAGKTKKVVKAGKVAIKVANITSDFKRVRRPLTMGKYDVLRKGLTGVKEIQVHHIVEKRLLPAFKPGIKTGDMLSIPLETNLHKKITKRWRKAIKYGTDYKKINKKRVD